MTKSDHVGARNGSGDRASQISLPSRLLSPNQMPRVSNSRSVAQLRQTASLLVPCVARRRTMAVTGDEQAEILHLKAGVKELQRQLRNERKRTGVCLPSSTHTGIGFVVTSVQLAPLTSPVSARTRSSPPTSSFICVVLRETVAWFPSSSLVTVNCISLRPGGTASPSSCLCITYLQPSTVSRKANPPTMALKLFLRDPSQITPVPIMQRTLLLLNCFNVPLPWIWIDIPPGGDRLFTMSAALTLEQESRPNASYTLTGVIYAGAGHFSARFMDASGRWWAYDGMVNSGQPSLDSVTEDTQLTALGDRVMHILFYRLDPPIALPF